MIAVYFRSETTEEASFVATKAAAPKSADGAVGPRASADLPRSREHDFPEDSKVFKEPAIQAPKGESPNVEATRPDVTKPSNSPTENSDPSEFEIRDAGSAVGRRFPLSASVVRTCELPADGKSHCPYLAEFLDAFSIESRDISWARDIEEKLERLIESSESGKFSVRSIECRTTKCVAEVVSRSEFFIDYIEDDPELGKRLRPDAGDLGFEKDVDGTKITVTVLTFHRR
jgi:hypothetical protein